VQVPLQPIFLLLIFNLYTAPWTALLSAASAWEGILRYLGPFFIGFEGLASLIVVQVCGVTIPICDADHLHGFAQKLGRMTAALIEKHEAEGLDFGVLIFSAAAYVLSAWWIAIVSRFRNSRSSQTIRVGVIIHLFPVCCTWQTYPYAAISPLASTLLGASITALIFLTLIGFALRRTNVIESSGMALYLAYNVWLCSDRDEADLHWLEISAS